VIPFRILHAGDWTPDQVVSFTEPNSRAIIAPVETAIEQAWERALARPGVLLFDGPMCRLQSWQADPQSLRLNLAPSSYKAFFGTNISHPEFAAAYGPAVMANPLGVSPALRTSDGWLLMGRRNASVAYYPGRVHPFAGCLEPGDTGVFNAVERELAEELSLTPEDITTLRCTGLIAETNLNQTELIFAATVSPTRDQLIARLDPAEHSAVWSSRDDARSVAGVITSPDAALTPIAIASLLLEGRLRFGTAWFEPLAARFQ
jgi:8-oxo-dGTP pyrophosphatase MutT (NUDIX family)